MRDDEHPLATYTRNFTDAYTQMVSERIAQEGLRDDQNNAQAKRNAAAVAVSNLNDSISLLSSANAAFLVKIFTAQMAPSTAVVDEAVAMLVGIASSVTNPNRPAVMIGIVAAFLNGAISAYIGNVTPDAPLNFDAEDHSQNEIDPNDPWPK
jgi:hypothetical protein